MYVRIWSRDGRVSDRPTNIVWDYPDEPYRYRAAEWVADELGGPFSRGIAVVVAAQVFADDGLALSQRMTFSPPYAIHCGETPAGSDRWTYRVDVGMAS